MSSLTPEQAMTIVGTIGGFAISLSLVPQVYLTYRTKCADDISYTYQFIYIFGTALVNTYAIYFNLYAVYIPCLVEFSLIVTMTIMKALYPARQDLIDISRHSLKLSQKGSLTSENLSVIKQLITHHEEVASDGEHGSKEFDKHLLRKAIAVLKHVSVEHQDPEAADPTELEDSSFRTGNQTDASSRTEAKLSDV